MGGTLTYAAGWTWIFWFLSIASGVCLTLIILFLPETSRNIVDNGSLPPPRILRLPLPVIFRHWEQVGEDDIAIQKPKLPNPLRSISILVKKDNLVIIVACGLMYVVYTCINASLSVIFIRMYNLNQWEAGLIYLPFGLGGVVSTFFSGPLLNNAYRQARSKRGLSTDKAIGDDLDTFPVEKARIGVIWIPLILTAASVVAFGWTLHYKMVCICHSPSI